MQHLQEGFDPTGVECITTAMLLQMIRNAKPFPEQGFIIWSESAPDVVTNPELSEFLWGELNGSGDKTGDVYYYDGTAWELLTLEVLDNSITLAKLSGTGASAYSIIQRNAANTAFIFTSIINAIQDGTLPPGKLESPNNVDSFILTSIAGVKAFTTFASFITAITNGSIALTKLTPAGANLFLRMNVGGTAWEARTADISDLLAAGSAAGQAIRRNAGNTGWEFFNPSTSSAVPTFIGPVTIYNIGGAIAWTTYNGSAATLAGKSAAIIQVDIVGDDPTIEVFLRKDAASAEYLAGKCAGDTSAFGGQALIPVTAAGLLDYEVVVSGAGSATVTIKLVGYIG